MTDIQLMEWLENNLDGGALVSDDAGRFAVVFDGCQNVPEEKPTDISTSFWIDADQWCNSVREAIEKAVEKDERET